MGSNQSSANEADGDSISIDPSGKITRKPTLHSSTETKSQQYSDTENKDNSYNNNIEAPATPIDQPQSIIIPSPVQTSEAATPIKQTEELNLKEADQILSNLKDKYKYSSQEMAGKQHGVFDEVERNLIQCYRSNKNDTLACSQAIDDYKSYVRAQRGQLLKQSVDVPLITTILVIVTCLLLHITTVSCYGAMSIDLGSEWMKVGLVAPTVQMDIVLNAQSQRKTPMAIAFSNGERFIGDTALDIASKYPEKAYTHFLDLVGKTVEHESVKHYEKRFPYASITSHQPNSTSIILNHPEGLKFTPLELIAMMIEHAHDQVSNVMTNNEAATDVVITVPPFFNSVERRVIEDAARLVGLNVLRLTNVNSAFALSYGIFRHKDYLPESPENSTSILFFDQGASHTSATLADYHLVEQFDEATGLSRNESLPTVTIRAQVYDRYLGGFDMQLRLRDYLIRAFSKNTKIDESRVIKRGRSSAKLLKESARVKKVLSANTEHVVRVENVIDDKDLKQPITRQEFEDLNKEYLDKRIAQLLDRLYDLPNTNRDEPLESVIIVGGNTRTPKIQQVLLDYFKLDTLGKSINADEGAALAALYQAASLGRGFRVKKFVLEEFGEERKRFDPTKAGTTSQQASTEAPITVAPTGEHASSEATSNAAETNTEAQKDPNSIYSDSELERISRKLADLREQDFMRLQRLSLRNSLESLLSEARSRLGDDDEKLKDKKDEIQKAIKDTYTWLEEGPFDEINNVTILADKFHSLHVLVNPVPPPPPPPPEPEFDPSTVDLSSVLNNATRSIMDALNFTNPFATQPSNESESNDGQQPTATTDGAETTTSSSSEQNESPVTPDSVKRGPPPHTDL